MWNKRTIKKLKRTYRKKLTKLAKTAKPWESGFLLEYMVEYLKFMRDFYMLSLNDSLMVPDDTRLETLNTAITEYNMYVHTEDKYYKVKPTKEGGCKIITLYDSPVENQEKYIEEEKLHWDNLWKVLHEHFREWWD